MTGQELAYMASVPVLRDRRSCGSGNLEARAEGFAIMEIDWSGGRFRPESELSV